MSENKPKQGEDKKKRAGEHLKTVDRLFKAGELEAALQEVQNALDADPGNFYALAYLERIEAAQRSIVPEAKDKGRPEPRPGSQEEARRKFLEEKRLAEAEARKKAEDDRRRAEEELRRRGLEQEILRQREEEERRRADEGQRIAADVPKAPEPAPVPQEAATPAERETAESDPRKKLEDAARRKIEEELRRRIEDERSTLEREQAVRDAREEGKREARDRQRDSFLDAARRLQAASDVQAALLEVMKAIVIDPRDPEAARIERALMEEQRRIWEAADPAPAGAPSGGGLEAYKRLLSYAWRDGALSGEEQEILRRAKEALGVGEQGAAFERDAKLAAYRDEMRAAWSDGVLTPEKNSALERLRNELGIAAEQHLNVEQEVRKGTEGGRRP